MNYIYVYNANAVLIKIIIKNMEYQEKLDIANNYLSKIVGVDWEDLPDINSLHDCETKEDIIEACKERINEI